MCQKKYTLWDFSCCMIAVNRYQAWKFGIGGGGDCKDFSTPALTPRDQLQRLKNFGKITQSTLQIKSGCWKRSTVSALPWVYWNFWSRCWNLSCSTAFCEFLLSALDFPRPVSIFYVWTKNSHLYQMQQVFNPCVKQAYFSIFLKNFQGWCQGHQTITESLSAQATNHYSTFGPSIVRSLGGKAYKATLVVVKMNIFVIQRLGSSDT